MPSDPRKREVVWPWVAVSAKNILAVIGGAGLIIGVILTVYQNRDWVGIKYSDISIRPSASTQLYMLFSAENDGNKAGSIGRVTVKFQFIGDSEVISYPLRLDLLEYAEGKTLIKPTDTQELRVYFANNERYDTVRKYIASVGKLKEAKCKFDFEVINYDGSRVDRLLDLDCAQYFGEYLGLRNSITIQIAP
jgi:hypothetical protein